MPVCWLLLAGERFDGVYETPADTRDGYQGHPGGQLASGNGCYPLSFPIVRLNRFSHGYCARRCLGATLRETIPQELVVPGALS